MIRRLKKLEKKLNILIVDGDVSEAEELENEPVSYTHLTLPTKLEV